MAIIILFGSVLGIVCISFFAWRIKCIFVEFGDHGPAFGESFDKIRVIDKRFAKGNQISKTALQIDFGTFGDNIPPSVGSECCQLRENESLAP